MSRCTLRCTYVEVYKYRPLTLWKFFYNKVLYTTYERMRYDELVQTLNAHTLSKDDALVMN